MKSINELNIPSAILEIRSIDLTKHGQVKLMQFAIDAIREADKMMMKKPLVDNPYGYFTWYCNNWHKKNNTGTNWPVVESIYKEYEIDRHSPTIASKGRSKITLLSPSSHNQDIQTQETPRRVHERVFQNQHTSEEYKKIKEYHAKILPWEYERLEDSELERKPVPITIEEELTLPLEDRQKLLHKIAEDWESNTGKGFRFIVGEKLALELYGKVYSQIEHGTEKLDEPHV